MSENSEEARVYIEEMKKRGIHLYRVADMSPEELTEYMAISRELAEEIVNLARKEVGERMEKKRKGNKLSMLPHVGKKRAEIMQEKELTIEKIAAMRPDELLALVPNLRRREAEDIIIAAELRMETTLQKNKIFKSELLNLPYIGISRAYKLHMQGMDVEKIAQMKPEELTQILPDLNGEQAEKIILAAELEVEKRKPAKPSGISKRDLKLRRGLVNGNSLINGKGVVNGLGIKYERKINKFPIFAIALVIIISSIAPLFILTESGRTMEIDGNFGDWLDIHTIPDPFGIRDGSLIEEKFSIGENRVYVYAKTGDALFAHPEGLYLFVDADKNSSTGYSVENIGADYLVKIIGWNERVESAEIYRYISQDRYNWSSFSPFGSPRYAFKNSQIEFSVPIHTHNPVMFLFLKNESVEDSSDLPLVEGGAFIHVQSTKDRGVERIDIFSPSKRRIHVKIGAFGNTSGLNYNVGLYLRDDSGFSRIGREEVNITVNGNKTICVIFNASGTGTLGFRVSSENESINVLNDVAPMEFNSSSICIDGNFDDWKNIRGVRDEGDDVEPNTNFTHRNIDLLEIKRSGRFFYIKTAGRILEGNVIPEIVEKRLKDSDDDGVPDIYDRYPHDFNNDGIDDENSTVVVNGEKFPDVDGDGIADYPYGPDMWLNTTIPDDFPKQYAGRNVHRYIGPVPSLRITGNDTFMVFIADNGSYHAPFLPFGSSHMVEISGKSGRGVAWLNMYDGEKWRRMRRINFALWGNQLEGNSIISGRIFVLSEDWLGQRDLEDYTRSGNITIMRSNSIPAPDAKAPDGVFENKTLYWNGTKNFGNLTLINCTVVVNGTLELNISGDFYMDNQTIINANETGYPGGQGGTLSYEKGESGSGSGAGGGGDYNGGGGGGGAYGGAGGNGGGNGGAGGTTYGTDNGWDIDMGSGGGGGAYRKGTWISRDGGNGGSGGGCVEIIAGGRATVDGRIYANGARGGFGGGGGGGGSGGGVLIYGKTVIINGTIEAMGGNGGFGISSGGGGGGGGRIKIFYVENLTLNGALNVSGGNGGESFSSSGSEGYEGTAITERVYEFPDLVFIAFPIGALVLIRRRKNI